MFVPSPVALEVVSGGFKNARSEYFLFYVFSFYFEYVSRF